MYIFEHVLNNLRCIFTFEENAEDSIGLFYKQILSNLFIDSNDYKSFRFRL